MRNLRAFSVILLLLVLSGPITRAQNGSVIQEYINTYKELAIQEMQRTGVPAAIKLAQGIHETMAGTSVLVVKSNNHFGIKCKATWTGASVSHDDDARGECFRKYPTSADSYRDHSDFLKRSDRYASLFALDPMDYESWAYGLKKAGYATNPRYPQVIIKLIRDYQLQDYTLIAMGKPPALENGIVKSQPVISTDNTIQIVTASTIAEPAQVQHLYPEGEFKINDTRSVYIQKGTSFLSIAQQYNVPLARLFEFNDMRETETVAKNQLIYLQRKRKTGNNEFHIVQRGETLYDIAQSEAIRLETLLEYNLLVNERQPAIGEQLFLRTKAPAAPKLVLKEEYSLYASTDSRAKIITISPAGHSNPDISKVEAVSYTVQPKETIYSISKKYSIKIEDILKWNQLSSYELKTGQQLKIYK